MVQGPSHLRGPLVYRRGFDPSASGGHSATFASYLLRSLSVPPAAGCIEAPVKAVSSAVKFDFNP